MKPSKFASKSRIKTEVSLQITPMASMFTVILVFLLKTFSPSGSSTVPDGDINLPALVEAQDFQEALKIEVSKSSVRVDDVATTKLTEFEFDPAEVAENGGLKSVNQAIQTEKERANETHTEVKDVLILADQKAPYKTLKRIIASASTNGYQKVKLVVIKAND